MKKIFISLLFIFVCIATCLADSGTEPVKDYYGNLTGEVTWSSYPGERIEREGWGNCYKVNIYNNSNETVSVTVTIKGVGVSKSETLTSYKETTITFYIGDNTDYKGYNVLVSRR